MAHCSYEISCIKVNCLTSSTAKGTQTQHGYLTGLLISLMKDQHDYRNFENSQFYQACSCKAKSVPKKKKKSKWYMLLSAILTRITIYFYSTDPLEDK